MPLKTPKPLNFAPALHGVGGRTDDEPSKNSTVSEQPKRGRGRPAAVKAKSRDSRFRPFNHILNEQEMLDARYLLDQKKIRGTLPEGVNDMSDLLQHLVHEWYECEKNTP